MAGKWQKNFTEGTSGAKVDDLLHVSSLQRLARERIVEMQASSSRRANTRWLQSHHLLPAWHIGRATFCLFSTHSHDSFFLLYLSACYQGHSPHTLQRMRKRVE